MTQTQTTNNTYSIILLSKDKYELPSMLYKCISEQEAKAKFLEYRNAGEEVRMISETVRQIMYPSL